MNRLGFRLQLNWKTMLSLFLSYPMRLVRFTFHFFQWLPFIRKIHLPSNGLTEWIFDLCFYLADLVLVPDIIELIFVWIQSQIRLLNEEEKIFARKYFGNKLNLHNVRISYRIPKRVEQMAVAFVTFNTIHFSKSISLPVFIHEMVHIWQFQKFGSVYIYRALKAQKSKEGYNYGGLENLYHKMLNNFIFTEFNFEQQGQIFEDYCSLKEFENETNLIAEASFEYFVSQVRDSRTT